MAYSLSIEALHRGEAGVLVALAIFRTRNLGWHSSLRQGTIVYCMVHGMFEDDEISGSEAEHSLDDAMARKHQSEHLVLVYDRITPG